MREIALEVECDRVVAKGVDEERQCLVDGVGE